MLQIQRVEFDIKERHGGRILNLKYWQGRWKTAWGRRSEGGGQQRRGVAPSLL